jgi:glycosyltransferase involved in cell wall biosynthesis
MEKITIVIPTYNRFKYLLNTIKSVKDQTYTNIEIIVVNDCSTDTEYYQYNWEENNIHIIHLPENSKTKFGFACPGGYQRNFGIEKATGDYIAFCDDDDIWFPQKLELQIKAMTENNCKMSCTDGLFGKGIYDNKKNYRKYNKEQWYGCIKGIYKRKESSLMDNGFPSVWNLEFLKVHNCAICSSVMIKKDIIDKVGEFIVARANEDYEYWRRTLKHTDCAYVDEPCMYYDAGHGDGQNY